VSPPYVARGDPTLLAKDRRRSARQCCRRIDANRSRRQESDAVPVRFGRFEDGIGAVLNDLKNLCARTNSGLIL
jgi:hypothetical protein